MRLSNQTISYVERRTSGGTRRGRLATGPRGATIRGRGGSVGNAAGLMVWIVTNTPSGRGLPCLQHADPALRIRVD
jgi:hypothetical protein